MWVLTQNKKSIVNLDNAKSVDLAIMGNVGQIVANNKAIPETLGEYRVYAARAILEEIALLVSKNETYVMPDEYEANEKYKEMQKDGE